MAVYQRDFYQRPNAFKFMLRALLPKKGYQGPQSIPLITKTWRSYLADQDSIDSFGKQTGIPTTESLHPLYLHVFSFRLLMAILTHPAFPLSVWKSLQIRNVIIQREKIPITNSFDLLAEIVNHRVLEKGLEVDLRCFTGDAEHPYWENTTTFYIRGDFSPDSFQENQVTFDIPKRAHSSWEFPKDGGFEFGKMTGDYNGIHLWDRYARVLGFKRALSHPQKVLGLILNRIYQNQPLEEFPFKLETWIKGPVFFGSNVELKLHTHENKKNFSLFVEGDSRPAINGKITTG